jgi:hypothetical protein
MAKQNINVGTAANDKKGDSLRAAFVKVNANFTELYTELGLVNDVTLSLGAFEFAGSTISTTDSTAIVIDQATTITSDLTVSGDILPSVTLGGNLGSPTQQWKSLYVSTNTIFINNVPLSLDNSNNILVNNTPISSSIQYTSIPNAPTDIADLTDLTGLLVAGVTNYNDLTNKPTLFSGSYADLTNKPDLGGTYQFSVAADDSTQRLVSTDEVIKFIGAGGITTASDAEGNITITGPGAYTLPTATTSVLGGVKVDGTSVTINGSGVISLNAGLAGSVTFKGGWDANTNTPELFNGDGTAGFMYIVTTSGVSNLGAGLTSFSSGDLVIYDGTNWINVAANNGVVSFNSRTGAVTLTSTDVTTALGYTPYNATNPNSYISSIDSSAVTTALGFTPYNATNPNSYIAASSLSVSTNTASGAGSLSYSAGVFTFTPAVAYTLPTATASILGGIKIDNNTIVINNGVISVGGALTSATIFKGSWDASANTPTLGASLPAGVAAGWQYIVSVQGTRDIGAGSTSYTVGDLVIYNGTTWSRIPGGNTVTAFNSRQGAITLTSEDVTTALGFTPISLASVSNYQFSVAADDSTQRLISSDEVVKFVGAGGITTASDAEGAITITGPDLSTYATQSYVTTRGYLTTVDYNNLTNKPEIPQQFTFNVAGDDSTMRTIGSEETIKFIGSGGITTTTDVEGNVNIILGSLNAVNLIGTTLATSVVNSSLTSVGTLTRLNVSRDVTARGFNTDSITMIGNRIATTVTNANLEIEFSGTGGLVANNVADATTASTAKSVGYLGLPQSGTSTTATLAMSDAGKHIYITSTGQTITIPAASSVAYPIGTTLTFISGSSATTTTIAITTDTLRLAGGTSTGSRTLAANGMATAVKVSGTSSSGVWYINGTGLT